MLSTPSTKGLKTMLNSRLGSMVLSAILASLAMSQAAVACDPFDLAGRYQTFSISTGSVDATEKCTLRIGLNGKVRSGTICHLRTAGNVKLTTSYTGGRFTISDDCQVTGTMKAKTFTARFDGWLSQNGQVIMGTFNARVIPILLTGVKTP